MMKAEKLKSGCEGEQTVVDGVEGQRLPGVSFCTKVSENSSPLECCTQSLEKTAKRDVQLAAAIHFRPV